MYRKIYLLAIFVFFMLVTLSAQINKRDSAWIADIISQGGEYQISDEVLEEIRRGKLIDIDMFNEERIESPDLIKDKTEPQKNMLHGLNLLHLSPTEALLYQNRPDFIIIVKSAALSMPDNVLVKEYYQIPRLQLQTKEPFTTELNVHHGSFMNFIIPKPIVTFSIEEGLEEIFSPEERQKTKNRKDANSWKNYNLEDINE